ncbi:hypothetical protein H0H92_009865 [Tricholoma furcatifolium]|nr:hypothetical protein H0H92_009865 [Tricholoma furcatifolium]
MAITSAIHDPLTINLRRQTTLLLENIPNPSKYATDVQNANSIADLLNTLSQLLSHPPFTLTIATLYRPILFDLCARWLDYEQNTEEQVVALCLLLENHEELFPILFRILNTTFSEGLLGSINSLPSPLLAEVPRLHRLLLAQYRLLRANRELPQLLVWSSYHLSKLIWTPQLDNGVRLLAIRCYAMQCGMAEAEREVMEREVLGEPFGVDCPIEYGSNLDATGNEVDGWIMPVLELQRIKEMREQIAYVDQNYYSDVEGPLTPIQLSDLSKQLVNLHGVFLLRASCQEAHAPTSPLISTPTTVNALRSIALHLSLRLPTLLTSPPSSGKSLFLSHLAELVYPGVKNQIITIHLADTSLDPRALLGSYVSSPTQPGTFEWKEGVLVRSLREGKWVVFEDIDRGSSEVLGVIKPLVESLKLGKWIGGRASIQVPSRGRVVAADGFALFATRSTAPSRNGTFAAPTFFGAHKFHEVIIPSPSPEELRTILDSRFPRLAGNATLAIIRLWDAVKALGPAASTRDIGLRELEKFCTRMQRLLPPSYHSTDVDMVDTSAPLPFASIFPNPTLREDIYLEARDVFFGAGSLTASARAHTESIAQIIADHLGLDPERRTWILNGRVPEFGLEKDVNGTVTAVRVARTYLPARATKLGISQAPTRPFAMHKPAVVLLSRIATAVALSEPVLLTGETGTGKTSVVTHLSSLLRRPLISLNLSHQTESSDLLGGFKPVDARIPGAALQQRFLDLFGGTFSRRKNEKFEVEVRKAVAEAKWRRAVGLWKEGSKVAIQRIQTKGVSDSRDEMDVDAPRKRRKVENDGLNVSAESWATFVRDVEEFEVQHVQGKGKFAFGFVEGPLVKALRSGDWVLLDEINLASPETLECISGLLHGPTASITLTEQGSLEPVPRHPDFRLFACMNPATDVGKKDLPPNIRSRFTEIDVPPPDADKETLLSIVNQYIGSSALGDKGAIMNVAEFYSAVKELAEKRQIADGSNHRPHFSMRTLARALTFASDTASMFRLRRAIWEGCLMAFTMVLDAPSAELVTALAHKYLLAGVRNPRSLLTNDPQVPHSRSADEFIKFGPFYLERGPLPEDPADDYIITPSVETKLIDLARIILTRRSPILIEGPTSAGKTSSVEYLAKRTGHRFIRINNHEHTDIQEYIGSYVSDPQTGKLVFKDGLLVRALRNGDWIVLDELNLAPTDVLEALNRLLDDNRELVIPETQEVVKPHPHFMLFATQNPPGLYAGRKVLSRAFRNRFLEVHFEDVPQAELETILCQRCQIAPSYGKKIVTVFHELQKRRQSSRVFESKQGFATLRDLFRWAGRDAVGYQELAENGYMLLAERARRDDDKAAVKEVIESVMNVKIDESTMYDFRRPDIDMASYLGCSIPTEADVIWTSAMQRLFTLVSRALRFNEPVLLVGETGAGKTSVCQVFATATSQRLHGLNCHQNTETADLIGGLRPLRNRSAREAELLRESLEVLEEIGVGQLPQSFGDLSAVLTQALNSSSLSSEHRARIQLLQTRILQLQSIFEWHDGPLVEAMRHGDVFLLDEISLADDSVLERLNSVLEPGRSIVLAEKGGGDEFSHPALKADNNFKLVATMNPGGDYGKKELSPALRNRFTEIWVPRVEDRGDLELIVGNLWKHETLKQYTSSLLDFIDWLCTRVGDRSLTSLRDVLAWVVFTNAAFRPESPDSIPSNEIFHHAAHMTFLDGLGSLPQLSSYTKEGLQQLKDEAMSKLMDLVPLPDRDTIFAFIPRYDSSTSLQFGSFTILKGPQNVSDHSFNLQAPTTQDNAMRVVRACQVPKPILLEGSPGVGKTSLITALANISGHELCRINLSDQTDLIDLFGSDLPVEGGGPGEFAWKDAEFLKALQDGHWVLLDEMNLAPQAVLEGLNAVLDHRGTVYIPELGRSFVRHPNFRIFAAQNPLNQGGGRKGLPKSFVNRFTKVYVDELTPSDLLLVCEHLFPEFDQDVLRNMITYNKQLQDAVGIHRRFGREGSPWEFNLRDVIRWASLLRHQNTILHPSEHLHTIYLHRFRTEQDRLQARMLFDQVFSTSTTTLSGSPNLNVSARYLEIGRFVAERRNAVSSYPTGRILKAQLSYLESLGHCISRSWLAILTGPRDCGKSHAVRVLSHFTGNILQEISVNSSTDTMDILGSFEQVDLRGRANALIDEVLSLFEDSLRTTPGSKVDYSSVDKLRSLRLQASASQHLLLKLALDCLALLSNVSEVASTLASKLDNLLTTTAAVGRFEWVDGPLVKAMKSGHWLLMDGANLCNPSVLDRLNSLCEQNGILTLSERGYVNGRVEVLRPHPNFRLFMTVDPQFGELSRAMRNRGIEISLISWPVADDTTILGDSQRLPPGPPDMKSWSLGFETARRGLTRTTVTHDTMLTTSGRALDQDSALSSIIDRGPMAANSFSEELTDAHLFFVARTTIPAYVSSLNRWLALLCRSKLESMDRLQAFLNVFANNAFCDVFVRLREAYSLSSALPSDLVLTQPMDFYMNAPPCIDKNLDAHNPSKHHIVLEALDVLVALYLDSEDQHSYKDQTKPIEKSGRKHQAGKDITVLLEAIQDASRSALNLLAADFTVHSAYRNLQLSTMLLSYSRYLRKILMGPTFDFSAIQAACRWVADALEDSPSVFSTAKTCARALQKTISLSSGLGLNDIWSTLFVDRPLAAFVPALDDIENLSNRLNGKDCHSLRRQTSDFMALHTLPVNLSNDSEGTLIDLKADLEGYLLRQGVEDEEEVKVDASMITAELQIFSNVLEAEGLIQIISGIIETACTRKGGLLRLVPYQHLLWSLQAGKGVVPIFAEAQVQWLTALWNTPCKSSELRKGPLLLLQPTQLISTFATCDWTRRSLRSIEAYESETRRHSNLLFLQSEKALPRIDELLNTLSQSLALVVECFRDSFPSNMHSAISSFSTKSIQLATSSSAMMTLVRESSHEAFKGAFKVHLLPALQRLEPESSREKTIMDVGFCWIAIGNMLLELLIPDTPIDPAAIDNCTTERRRRDQVLVQMQLSMHRNLEKHTTGNGYSELIGHLTRALDGVTHQLASAPSLPLRGDVARLDMFWSEVAQFQNHVVSCSRIQALVNLFASGDQNAILREDVMQQSMAGFCHRLCTVYADYADLCRPLHLAILYLRIGLRLIAYPSLNPPVSASLASSLVAFPSVCSSSGAIQQAGVAGPSAVAPFRYLLLTLSAISKEQTLGNLDMDAVETVYSQALHLWLIDRAKESEAGMAASSLYRRKNLDHDDIGEAELEEREFLDLFPSFENVLDSESNTAAQRSIESSALVSQADMSSLVSLHRGLFGLPGPSSNDLSFIEVRRTVLESILSASGSALPEYLDDEGLQFQFDLLHNRLAALQHTPLIGSTYNFYVDPNVAQVKRAASVVSVMRAKLEAIIQEWPDQMVLQHLRSRCDVVLGLDLHSPIAKILSALEQLLLQTEDWEMYANRENSLKLHQQALIGLIVEWRRLELSCWQVLLESQLKAFSETANEWWFRLYDAAIRGPLDSCDRDDGLDPVGQYLETLIPLINDFIRTSPLGEFDARMRLLHSFENYIFRLYNRKEGHQRFTLARIHRVLNSSRCHFSLFSTEISSHLAQQRATLEKEIRGFIKLASWKDINVQALKASAQRTHHQLYKIIRKFREVLRQPISERLHPQQADTPETKPSPLETLPFLSRPLASLPEGTGSSDYLVNLTKTFNRFDVFIAERIRTFIHSKSAHIVDGFAVDIIIGAKELATLSIPTSVTGEKRAKQQKALVVRKRKAWSDLLKELKRVGLTANVKPEILRQNSSSRWLGEQPVMPEVDEPTIMSTLRGEEYLHRLCGLLPELRSLTSAHHSDLTTRELQRGIMFLESGFSMAIDLRAKLATALEQFIKLQQVTARLKMVSSQPKIVHGDTSIPSFTGVIKSLLSRLSDATQEILQGLHTYDSFNPKLKVADQLVQEVKALGESTSALLSRVVVVNQNVGLTTLPVLLKNEHETLIEAQKFISAVSTTLCDWTQKHIRLRYLFEPVNKWLDSQEVPSFISAQPSTSLSREHVDTVINILLVTIQNMVAKCPDPTLQERDQDDDDDNYLIKDQRIVRDLTQHLNINAILSALDNAINYIAASPDSRDEDLRRVLPFLDAYTGLVKDQLLSHSQWTKALFKLNYILCSVMTTLAKQGFCQPPDTEESGESGDTKDSTGGVGLGEGSGAENVSKEIEDESQVEGLRDDDAQDQEKDKRDDRDKGDDDALEMNEDFGGEMEDVPENESQDEAESDNESDAGPEEQLGDLDPSDPSAVDEKMWGDEKGPEDGKQDEKTDQDRSAEQSGESEVVAKEGKSKEKDKDKAAEEKQEEGGKDNSQNAEDESMAEAGEEAEAEEDENQPQDGGAPMDPYIDDANTLDLPDDMDLGGDEKELGGDDLPEDMEGDEEHVEDNMDSAEDEQAADDTSTEQWRQEEQLPNDEPEPMDQEPDIPNQPLEADGTDDTQGEEKDGEEEEAIARPDVSSGDGMASSDEIQNPERGESAATGQAGSSMGDAGKDTAAESQTKDESGMPEVNQPPAESLDSDSQAAGTATSGVQEGQAPSQPDTQTSTNPLRSLGDALKEIRQRFDEILNSEQRDAPRERMADVETPSQVEYLQPDDADHNMEALGPAGEEQTAKLNDLKLVSGDEHPVDYAPMDIDDLPTDIKAQKPVEEQKSHGELTAPEQHPDVEGAILQNARPVKDEPALTSDLSTRGADVDMETADEAVEAELRSWQSHGFPDSGAENVWRLYESLTHDLAYALCEQLRLILEPTLATRLKGDYRTGKRLNMKKIISYIASDYTKDKIWLRRTRPSQREYQVLISIDDSRSMAESHSIHLAYQTLALVSKALGRLESGDIAIAKFGEAVDILHGFDEGPFTDQAGIKVMNAFRFNQKATNVLSLVETSLKVLENARERRAMSSATAADLWQLQFIISDGMCQDHERLRTVLRKAEEQRVMVVFVIIDSLHTMVGNVTGGKGTQGGSHQGSILTMDKAEFKNVDGRMELQLQKYLDSFPFEYYVVLRNVEALPEVLASTLKQFFERISEE